MNTKQRDNVEEILIAEESNEDIMKKLAEQKLLSNGECTTMEFQANKTKVKFNFFTDKNNPKNANIEYMFNFFNIGNKFYVKKNIIDTTEKSKRKYKLKKISFNNNLNKKRFRSKFKIKNKKKNNNENELTIENETDNNSVITKNNISTFKNISNDNNLSIDSPTLDIVENNNQENLKNSLKSPSHEYQMENETTVDIKNLPNTAIDDNHKYTEYKDQQMEHAIKIRFICNNKVENKNDEVVLNLNDKKNENDKFEIKKSEGDEKETENSVLEEFNYNFNDNNNLPKEPIRSKNFMEIKELKKENAADLKNENELENIKITNNIENKKDTLEHKLDGDKTEILHKIDNTEKNIDLIKPKIEEIKLYKSSSKRPRYRGNIKNSNKYLLCEETNEFIKGDTFYLKYLKSKLNKHIIAESLYKKTLFKGVKEFGIAHEESITHIYIKLDKVVVSTKFNLQQDFTIYNYQPIIQKIKDYNSILFIFLKDSDYILKMNEEDAKNLEEKLSNFIKYNSNIQYLYDNDIIEFKEIPSLYKLQFHYNNYEELTGKEEIKRVGVWLNLHNNLLLTKLAKNVSYNYYIKSLDKNWDGYKSEDLIIIKLDEKCQKNHARLLKKWMSPFLFPVQQDDHTIYPIYTKVIVCSMYMKSEYFKEFPNLYDYFSFRLRDITYKQDELTNNFVEFIKYNLKEGYFKK